MPDHNGPNDADHKSRTKALLSWVDIRAPSPFDRWIAEQRELTPKECRNLWFEVAAVGALGVLPFLVWGVVYFLHPYLSPRGGLSFAANMGQHLLTSVQVMVPVLYIMWRSRHGWQGFGLDKPRWWPDIGFAVLFVVVYSWCLFPVIGYGTFYIFFVYGVEGIDPDPMPSVLTPLDWGLIVLMACANGFTEELVMRSYLITRLEQLLKSTWAPVAITTAVFAAYHLYQGLPGAVTMVVLGLLFALAFVWLRRVWPLAFAHILLDLFPYLWYREG